MVEQIGQCVPLPEIEIVDEEPSAELRDAAEVGLADYAAGRFVVCDTESFNRLLSELAARPQAN